ncbi:hypothetical protein EPA93_09745 [Ktedonosporobacter rubrisoli]|uniref:ABC transporter permease n=1 Tax=Ktedonosporobacter rubrisoli TaxID=2509675 RepID=A0A4P6JNG7_KTERU|nr:ABC transporter permease [Ktedonosporobacter rubrisoli]QBD76276.1 hypothetical protein EPA93_09745 [Ktedonosporobacter rubrisoli]
MFMRILVAELLKYKRTLIPLICCLLPLAFACMMTFFFWYEKNPLTSRGRWHWESLLLNSLFDWCSLILPLFLAVIASIATSVDSLAWKQLLIQPLPRASIYTCKLLVVCALALIAQLIYLVGTALGLELLALPGPIPWGSLFLLFITFLPMTLPILGLHYWIALRARSVTLSVGLGIVGTYVTFISVGLWTNYITPWTFPLVVLNLTVFPLHEHVEINSILLFPLCLLGLALSIAGGSDFARKDIA